MIYQHVNYRTYLKALLHKRLETNPRYSLRAFAAKLGLNHSSLSLVMAGKKNLSLGRATEIAKRLGLDRLEKDYFCALVQLETAKNPTMRQDLLAKLRGLRPCSTHPLQESDFRQLPEWYNFAILAMTELAGFTVTPAIVAERLGINVLEAQTSMDRMCQMGIMGQKVDGTYYQAVERLVVDYPVRVEELIKIEQQMLEKAAQALDQQDKATRIHGSETFPLSKENLPRAREITEDYLRQMNALSTHGNGKSHTDIYFLTVHMFSLTRPEKEA